MNNNKSNVVLPDWIWEHSKSNEELKRHILHYMRKYPGYTVLKVKGRMAVCEINR